MSDFIKNSFIWPGVLSDEPLTFKQRCEIQRRQMAICDIDWCGVEVEMGNHSFNAGDVRRLKEEREKQFGQDMLFNLLVVREMLNYRAGQSFGGFWDYVRYPDLSFTANQQTCIWEVRL